MSGERRYVSTGDIVASSTAAGLSSYLIGHGTTQRRGRSEIVATVSGFLERHDRLLTVQPCHTRYLGEIGDVVVGQVMQVNEERWKVEVGGHVLAVLHLASIHLPGGALRRRNAQDQMAIRQYFDVNDLIVCEVQKTRIDGSIHLHTRSERYGRLLHGACVQVQSRLIRRCKQHFQKIEGVPDVELILGVNGWLYVYPSERLVRENLVTIDIQEKIARICNCALLLDRVGKPIWNESISAVYSTTVQLGMKAKQVRDPQLWKTIAESANALMEPKMEIDSNR